MFGGEEKAVSIQFLNRLIGTVYDKFGEDTPMKRIDDDVVEALVRACREFGEEPEVGLYRAHDSYYRETSTAMIDTFERMKPWVDAGVKMIENESATLFTIAHRLGIRAGSICVSHLSMIEGTPYYEGPDSRIAYPEAFEDGFMR